MKYYIIAGESSGDLHARHLMEALEAKDAKVEICYWYKPELAYMGFVSVAMHLPEILRGMEECKKSIREFNPDRLILVDYPGFNLKIAAWFHKNFIQKNHTAHAGTPQVIYYIPPKIWAWKEGRIAQIRKYVDKVLSILPFEVEWYAKRYGHHMEYVGNPTLDEIDAFQKALPEEEVIAWKQSLGISEEKVVALLPGSRKQEIEQNLPLMLNATKTVGKDFRYVIASAPNISTDFYGQIIGKAFKPEETECRNKVVLAPCHGSKSSFMLMHCAHAALVTSGTATLETAIMEVPQVVCYAMRCGKAVSWLRGKLLKVPYVSLVNLIAGREVVPELVAGDLTQESLDIALGNVIANEDFRTRQIQGYRDMMQLLGMPGAPQKAAEKILEN